MCLILVWLANLYRAETAKAHLLIAAPRRAVDSWIVAHLEVECSRFGQGRQAFVFRPNSLLTQPADQTLSLRAQANMNAAKGIRLSPTMPATRSMRSIPAVASNSWQLQPYVPIEG